VFKLIGTGRIGDDRNRNFADAKGVEHVELPRLEAVRAPHFIVDEAHGERVYARGLGSTRGNSCRMYRVRSHRFTEWARIAATSSVRSIPTGHQVMHLPHPTHPEVPN
jgi:hypothetical protein